MTKRFYAGLSTLVLSSSVFAGSMGPTAPVVDKGFFVGIGGNYNSASLDNQKIWGKGVNDAYLGPILTSTGSAEGFSNPFYQTVNIFSPHAQAGYFQHFAGSPNFWGAKFSYDFLDAHFADYNMTIAQAGSNYNVITGVTTDFTGNYAVESAQTSVNHELLFLAFLGHSFEHIHAYLGGGAVLLGMQSNIYHLIGYADYNGMQGTDISGAPVNLSQSMWEWGGAGQLGLTYFIDPSWFLDVNYTYARTGRNTVKYVSPFTNQIGPDHLIGTSYINPSQEVAVQSVSLSINKRFG